MTTHFYTASSLDGFIATEDHSLDWLFAQEIDEDGPMAYREFIASIGALAMGAHTFEWVMDNDEGRWGYEQPAWVFTTRELDVPEGADVRLTRADVRDVHAQMVEAAGGGTCGSSVGEIWRVSSPTRACSTKYGFSTRR
ncbi:dihydrofolate reductase family protein [Microbacterium esteraromaticum]|uniref:dihydrofolate reductase family protein n=1 Tax=Microbacterium esteraromaticum TaxID=57043 RepID=UPI003C2E6923